MDYMVCTLRNRQFEIKDFWTLSERCTYCGSIKPEYFFKLIEQGYAVRSDKFTRSFSLAIDKNIKFCYEHFSHEDRLKLADMYKDKKITVVA